MFLQLFTVYNLISSFKINCHEFINTGTQFSRSNMTFSKTWNDEENWKTIFINFIKFGVYKVYDWSHLQNLSNLLTNPSIRDFLFTFPMDQRMIVTIPIESIQLKNKQKCWVTNDLVIYRIHLLYDMRQICKIAQVCTADLHFNLK